MIVKMPKNKTWYIKWATSIILLIGMIVGRGLNNHTYPFLGFDTFCSLVGAMGWCYMGFKWGDRAMILVNTVAALICSFGLFQLYSHWSLK